MTEPTRCRTFVNDGFKQRMKPFARKVAHRRVQMDRYPRSRSMTEEIAGQITWKRALAVVVVMLMALSTLIMAPKMVENVDASEILLVQSPSGSLSWHTQPGWICQCLGKVTTYRKSGQIRFDQQSDDSRIKIQFNDAGTGVITGSINYELPLDEKKLTEIHSFYPTPESLESRLIKPALNKSIYLTGPLMSSRESYAERRTQMIQYVEDQTQNGVYLTTTRTIEVPDDSLPDRTDADGRPIQPPMKRVAVVEIQTQDNPSGPPTPARAEPGQLARFSIRAFNFAIEDLDYEETVDKQIAQQQEITMAVQTSIAQAKQAQQDAITARAKGEANIATTRAAEEVEKTKAVVQGEKMRDVARLGAEEAGFYKTQQLLRADADAEYKRRILAADGALQQKIDAYKEVQGMWATAFKDFKGAVVPGVVMGGGAGAGTNSAQAFMDLMMMRSALDLQLNLTPSAPK